MTYYYFVWVRSSRYHGSEPLTYASDAKLATGSVVQVEMQRELVPGVISGPALKPRFKTKPIARVYELPPVPAHLLKLAEWLQRYYPAPLGMITQQLIPGNLPTKLFSDDSNATTDPSSPRKRRPSKNDVAAGHPDLVSEKLASLPPLSPDQAAALQAMQDRDSYLVHGETGSGKTRLYVEMTARAIAAGKSAIILTPEISLTSQLGANFQAIFGDRVIIQHSQQAPAERRQAWLDSLQSTQPVVIIGPRSALFSPVPKLGLIVLDEAHEAAYKQEQAPQYQAGRVAAFLASLTRATLILGSATPSVSDYYLAEQKQKPIIELKRLTAGGGPQLTASDQRSKVAIIDMKDRSLFPRSPYLSLPLVKAVEAALQRGEQSLLYLNRRGTARLIMCENCGWQATCPHCDLPLTYHGDTHELRCHSCNHHELAPSSCPACGHPSIIFRTAGTKAIVDEVHKLWPSARIARFDTDNLKAERFEQHFEAVKRGDFDILVGTQLLAKGLDLPKLSTLGVLLADTSLYLPDFSAQERTFQLISQVLGRIGRGHVAGHAIIQTYHPEHPILTDAVNGDYESFYKRELVERQQFLFPPFCYLLKLTARRASLKSAENAALKLKSEIESSGGHVRVEGPAPSFYEKFQSKFQWQLVIKSKDRSELVKIISSLPANWSYDLDPADLL